ncbi:uncharacterized protein LOC141688433 [Apium graveolens]|uniref:uncharacterized protein LOC141688433 n=1 Tax=Apium graveolens TaxID=4045 RepID=UPI003D79269D
MWRIKAPPKVLNLIWRALSGCLPTNVMLQQRHVPVLSICPVCEGENETICHALVLCPVAIQCWQKAFPEICTVSGVDFFSWFDQVLSRLNAARSAEAATLCWAVWNARNDKVWKQRKARINAVVSSATQYLKQWKEAQSRSSILLSQPFLVGDGVSLWVKPQEETIKVSVDAAVFSEFSAFGIGLVARDSSGSLVQAKAKLFQGASTPALAEVIDIKEALSWMKEEQWNKVVVESDCLVAVQAIRSQVPMRSPFGKVVEDCKKLFKESQTISLFFVRQSANEAAHYIARESYSFPDRVLVGSSVPIEFLSILQANLAHQ